MNFDDNHILKQSYENEFLRNIRWNFVADIGFSIAFRIPRRGIPYTGIVECPK